MKTKQTVTIGMGLMVALASCRHDNAAPASKAAEVATAPTAPTPTPTPTTGAQAAAAEEPTGVPGSSNMHGVAQVLAAVKQEAATRAQVKVPTDAVFAALQSAGIELGHRKQVYAALVGAQYCEAAGAPGIAVSVCEYRSAEAAAKGMESAGAKFKAMAPSVMRTRNDSTVLTVNRAPAAGPNSVDPATQIIKVFSTLGGRA
ncbi:MAG TPA: hypothetical protein PLF40_24165 [Kofleriaceae bacterium]|nr:hypothetical protein [Kofleriaceae bacterium]